MLELNNRYALDGRDPNSTSGIFWCLGRYDRPWGPERPIFGTVRYMSSENTARKMRVARVPRPVHALDDEVPAGSKGILVGLGPGRPVGGRWLESACSSRSASFSRSTP